jgi:hypothetical protein
MVRKMAENGTFYHEPPYTEEEDLDFYRRICAGPVRILHGPPPARNDVQPQRTPRRPLEE